MKPTEKSRMMFSLSGIFLFVPLPCQEKFFDIFRHFDAAEMSVWNAETSALTIAGSLPGDARIKPRLGLSWAGVPGIPGWGAALPAIRAGEQQRGAKPLSPRQGAMVFANFSEICENLYCASLEKRSRRW